MEELFNALQNNVTLLANNETDYEILRQIIADGDEFLNAARLKLIEVVKQ